MAAVSFLLPQEGSIVAKVSRTYGFSELLRSMGTYVPAIVAVNLTSGYFVAFCEQHHFGQWATSFTIAAGSILVLIPSVGVVLLAYHAFGIVKSRSRV